MVDLSVVVYRCKDIVKDVQEQILRGSIIDKFAFNVACERGYLNIVKLFISHGAYDFITDGLSVAVIHNHCNIVEYLISIGAVITDFTLKTAIKRGNIEIIKCLVLNDANIQCGILNLTTQPEIIEFLISRGAT